MDRLGNDKENKELNFLNERVIRYRKEDIIRWGCLVILCVVIFILAAYVGLYLAKPFFSGHFSKKPKNNQQNIIMPTQDESNSQSTVSTEETPSAAEIQTTDDWKSETGTDDRISQEDMVRSVVVIGCGNNEMTEEQEKTEEKEKSGNGLADEELAYAHAVCGLVVLKNENIVILTYYDQIKGLDEVSVCFEGDKRYKGRIKSVCKDYRLALIEVRGTEMPADEFSRIKPAVFTLREDYSVSDQITFIGTSFGKEKLITNGSLTLVGNTVSIMDGEIEIFFSDILKEEGRTGFAFDETGHVIGMAINRTSGNERIDTMLLFVKIRDMKPYIDKMFQNRRIPYIGIYGREVTAEVIKTIDNEMPYGIYIFNRRENSPAYLAGIMNGDILVEINGIKISNFSEYIRVLHRYQAGQEIVVSVMRKGKDGYKRFNYAVKVNEK